MFKGTQIPDYWCRVDGDEAYIFIAHPAFRGLCYPMRYVQSSEAIATKRMVRLRFGKFDREFLLDFRPQQSILLRVSSEGLDFIESVWSS
ncbi:MAG: hypothetical protein ACP5QG_07295 [candidate division WOR-3 bacterium]